MADTTATTEPPFLLRATTRSGAGAFGVNGDQPTELIAVYDVDDLERRLAQVTPGDLTELRIEWRQGEHDRWVELALVDEDAEDEFLGMGMRWTCPHGDGIATWNTASVGLVLHTLYRNHRHQDPAPADPVCALTYGKALGEVERAAIEDFGRYLADHTDEGPGVGTRELTDYERGRGPYIPTDRQQPES